MQYFFCYSPRMHRALRQYGFRYICVGMNERSGETFWLYEGTQELNYFKDNVYQDVIDQF